MCISGIRGTLVKFLYIVVFGWDTSVSSLRPKMYINCLLCLNYNTNVYHDKNLYAKYSYIPILISPRKEALGTLKIFALLIKI
jgi:hypothetical protein